MRKRLALLAGAIAGAGLLLLAAAPLAPVQAQVDCGDSEHDWEQGTFDDNGNWQEGAGDTDNDWRITCTAGTRATSWS